ncbi:ty3-gypsy retrotransposon protein [Cucumis melo var. makuwa]|uniref:Ty3-gypsy retrotransposon protein n=1 Tax=Cucumis melo var. makuwa TaxID=1194695 RepID=A0A5A7VQ00_CUCMM|nr:ty3-gypsy retrotransposon protein [Cucumis melo var. makuwa]TYK10910.1 ty3-gypsy retrotransposon protein [Cucumis melo var. makuwa]
MEQISKSLKGGIVIKENLAIDEHNSSSERSNEEVPHPKKVNMLMKVVKERDFEIASLKNHIQSRDAAKSSHTHTL